MNNGEFYEALNKLTKDCGLPRAQIITALEAHKLDIMFNEGIIVLDKKVGVIK